VGSDRVACRGPVCGRCWSLTTGWPWFIGPESSGLRSVVPGSKHRNRHIVCVNLLRGENMPAQRIHQRLHQLAGRPTPIGQRGAIQIHAFARIDLRLSIEWVVVAVMWRSAPIWA
jgi:hypothetical protein